MGKKRHAGILADLEGAKGQGFLFVVMLKDFAKTLAGRVSAEDLPRLLADIESDSDWLEKWGEKVYMDTLFTVYMMAAKTLLKEYTAERVRETHRKRLEDGK